MSILSFRNSFRIFAFLVHYFPPFILPFAPQNCSDGAPAVFPCNATKVDGKRVFVCALDLMLGCELVEGQFYCCAQTETTTLSRLEMLLVDQMMAEEIKNNTLDIEAEETLEMMNEPLAPLGNNSSNFSQAAENNDGPRMATENGESEMGNGTTMMGEGEMEMETTTKMATRMAKMRKKSRRKQGMMVNVEKQILVDNSVEQEEEGEEKEGEGNSTKPMTSSNGAFGNLTMEMEMPSTTSASMREAKMGNQTTKRPICIDIGPQCLLTAKLCLNPHYSRLVRLQCPRTCNLCAPDGHRMEEDADLLGKCMDRGKDCGRADFLCKTPAFSALMAVECAKTCGHCDGQMGVHARGVKTKTKKKAEKSKKAEKCMDAYQRCQIWRLQGFCTSKVYSEFLKRRYCAKTCEFCEKMDNN